MGTADSSEVVIDSTPVIVPVEGLEADVLPKSGVFDEATMELVPTSCLAVKSVVCRAEVKLAEVEGGVDVELGETTILEAETGIATGQKLHNCLI